MGIWCFPIVFVGITASGRSHPTGKINAQAPAHHVQFMGAIVERFTRAPMPKPVPIVVYQVVLKFATGSRPLPQIKVEVGRWSYFL